MVDCGLNRIDDVTSKLDAARCCDTSSISIRAQSDQPKSRFSSSYKVICYLLGLCLFIFNLIFFFYNREVSLHCSLAHLLSHRLVLHQHLSSHIAYPGNPPELSNTHEGNFCTCHRTLFSDYSDRCLTTRSPERRFLTCITLALHLVQPHCVSITKHGHHISHHISNLTTGWAIRIGCV